MANFKNHISCSIIISFVIGLSFYRLYMSTITQTLFIIIFGIIGGMLPDIDHQNSYSNSIILSFISIAISIIFIFVFIIELGILLSLLLSICIYFFLKKYINKFINNFFIHRGVMHSLPMSFICAFTLILSINIITNDIIFSWLSGILLIIGYILHLFIDECCSFNIKDMRFKKSFGSALSLFSYRSIVFYLFIYIFLLFLFMLLPKDNIKYFFKSKFIIKNALCNLLPIKFT